MVRKNAAQLKAEEVTTPAPKSLEWCMFPECTKRRVCRGLCNNHYSGAHRLVQVGRVTWESLEAAGKVAAKAPHRRVGRISAWFLGAEKS